MSHYDSVSTLFVFFTVSKTKHSWETTQVILYNTINLFLILGLCFTFLDYHIGNYIHEFKEYCSFIWLKQTFTQFPSSWG